MYEDHAIKVEDSIRAETITKKNEKKRKIEEERKKQEDIRETQEKFIEIMDKIGTIWYIIDQPAERKNNENERDACCSVLSVAYENIYSMFELYENLIPQFTISKENHFILIQHFLHFVKIIQFDLIKTEADYISIMDNLITIFRNKKICDTLNIYNGLNFADIIAAIVKIAEINYNPDIPFSKHLENIRVNVIKPKQENFFKNPLVQKLLSEDVIGIIKVIYLPVKI